MLFSASKDHVINVWHSHNGERLGTYDGHNGTVWTIDVDCELEVLYCGYLLAARGRMSCTIWGSATKTPTGNAARQGCDRHATCHRGIFRVHSHNVPSRKHCHTSGYHAPDKADDRVVAPTCCASTSLSTGVTRHKMHVLILAGTADADITIFNSSATSTFLVSGSADNQMRLWNVRTGECLKVWEFPTAVKRVAWSEDGSKVRHGAA